MSARSGFEATWPKLVSGQTIDQAFPDVDPGVEPFGEKVLVQIRSAMKRTPGGVILTEDTIDTEKWNTQAAKVISVGPLAYHNRNTMAPWPEGAWVEPGWFVRVPKYGGDRWEVVYGTDEVALFALFKDLEILGRITTDPRAHKAFI